MSEPTPGPSTASSHPLSRLRLPPLPVWVWMLPLITLSWSFILAFLVRGPESPSVTLRSMPPAHSLGDTSPAWVAVPPDFVAVIREEAAPLMVPRVLQWVDTSGRASWEAARDHLVAGRFKEVRIPRSEGYTQSAAWFVLGVRNDDVQSLRWVVSLGQPYLDDIKVWVERASGSVEPLQMGDHHLGGERPLSGRLHDIPLRLDAGEVVHVWIRAATDGALATSIRLARPVDHYASEVRFSAQFGLFLGILALAVVVYGLTGLWLKDAMLLIYSGFLISLIALYLGQQGFILVLVPHPPWWLSDALAGGGSSGPWYAGSLLWAYALGLRTHYPRLFKTYVGIALIAFCALPLCVTPYYGQYISVSFWLSPWSSLLSATVIVLMWRRKPDPLFRLYSVAISCYLLASMVHVGVVMGWVPFSPTLALVAPLATLTHTLIMAVGLSLRIVRIRQERIAVEERNRAHQELVAMLTHEFRNPLSSIDRSANFLQALASPSAQQLTERLRNIRSQVQRLGGLVDGFLTIGQHDQLATRPQLRQTFLAPWLQGVVQQLGPDLSSRIRLELPSPTLEVAMDSRLMTIAFNNLIDNALRYSPEDAPVDIYVRRTSQGATEVVLQDHGPGLRPDELKDLGSLQYRLQEGSRRHGTGLGYRFAQQVAAAHGCELIAESADQAGLQVRMVWPAGR